MRNIFLRFKNFLTDKRGGLDCAAGVAVLALLVVGSAAQAEPNYENGVQYYKKGNYRAAADSFSKIENSGSQPKVLYYQALCNQQLGNSAGALQLYKQVNSNFPMSMEAKLAAQYLNQITGGSSSSNTVMVMTKGRSNSLTSSSDRLPESCGVPFHRGLGNHMFVTATVGGRTQDVIFDTGAAGCYFGKSQLAGARMQPTGRSSTSRGVGGEVQVDEYLVEIRLGDIVRTIPIMVSAKNEMDPLLGQTFFNPFRYDIDTSAGVIHFYKKGGASHEGFDTLNVPFVQQGNELKVPISVNGHQGSAFFDTGAAFTLISLQQLLSMGITPPSDAQRVSFGGVGGSNTGIRFRVDRFCVGPVQKSNFEITAGANDFSLIGQDFFKDKRFTIDNEAHVIKFVH